MSGANSKKKTLVLGVGNELLQDEGLGIHAVRLLAAYNLPPEVDLIEGGTAGPQLLSYLDDVDRLIILDCIDAHTAPGSIFRFKPEELGTFPQDYAASIHDVGLLEVLQLADLSGKPIEAEVFAMQPATIAWGLQLSPEIERQLPKLVDLVYQEILSKVPAT